MNFSFLLNFIKEDMEGRFADMLSKKDYDEDDIEDAGIISKPEKIHKLHS